MHKFDIIITYRAIASRISAEYTNSSAEWERAESPGPSFTDCHGINAWSLRVGEPKGVAPIISSRVTMGCSGDIDDGFNRVERGTSRHSGTAALIMWRVSSLE